MFILEGFFLWWFCYIISKFKWSVFIIVCVILYNTILTQISFFTIFLKTYHFYKKMLKVCKLFLFPCIQIFFIGKFSFLTCVSFDDHFFLCKLDISIYNTAQVLSNHGEAYHQQSIKKLNTVDSTNW